MVTRPYAGRRSVRCAADATKAAERRRRTPAGETTKSNAGTFNPAGDNAASDNPTDDNPTDDNPTDDNPTDDVSTSHVPAGDNAAGHFLARDASGRHNALERSRADLR